MSTTRILFVFLSHAKCYSHDLCFFLSLYVTEGFFFKLKYFKGIDQKFWFVIFFFLEYKKERMEIIGAKIFVGFSLLYENTKFSAFLSILRKEQWNVVRLYEYLSECYKTRRDSQTFLEALSLSLCFRSFRTASTLSSCFYRINGFSTVFCILLNF